MKYPTGFSSRGAYQYLHWRRLGLGSIEISKIYSVLGGGGEPVGQPPRHAADIALPLDTINAFIWEQKKTLFSQKSWY